MPVLLTYITDLLLLSASLGAAAYCMVLSRRLTRLGSFDKGIGSAIAVLSAQVEEMKTALGEAKAGSDGAGRQLNDLVRQAQDISAELEMMIAACHDFAETAIQVQRDDPDGNGTEDPENSADRALAASHDASELHQDRPDPEDQRTAEYEDVAEALPVFGSRRTAAREPDGQQDVPMFRHRANVGA